MNKGDHHIILGCWRVAQREASFLNVLKYYNTQNTVLLAVVQYSLIHGNSALDKATAFIFRVEKYAAKYSFEILVSIPTILIIIDLRISDFAGTLFYKKQWIMTVIWPSALLRQVPLRDSLNETSNKVRLNTAESLRCR